MTPTLLKYILKGALRGIEEYEEMLKTDHIDPAGKGAELIFKDVKLKEGTLKEGESYKISKPEFVGKIPPRKDIPAKSDPSTPIDLDELLEGV